MSVTGIRYLSTNLLALVTAGFLLLSPAAHATYTDLTGAAWVGSLSGVDTGCTLPADNGPFSESVTAIFSNQSGGSFNVSITTTESNGEITVDAGSGSFISENQIQFTVTHNEMGSFDSTTVNGTINGNSISFTFSGSNTGGDNCNWTGSGSVSRTDAQVIVNPEETASSTVTEAVLFNTQIQGTAAGIGSHVGAAMSGARKTGGKPRVTDNQFILEGSLGLNAGDGAAIPFGVWGNYSYTDYENEFVGTAFDGSSHTFLGGVDFSFIQGTVAGVAFGYDVGDIDTTFNSGNQETDTYTIAPYFGAVLSDTWSVDASAGFSRVEYDQYRTTGTTRVTSSPEADRIFVAMNLNGVTYYDNWILGARVGYLWARNKLETYTESNGNVVGKSESKVGTWSVGGDAAYSMGNYEPFIGLTYNRDYSLTKIAVIGGGAQPANDRDDFLLRLGLRYFNTDNLSGNIEYSKRLSRKDFDEDRISATLRIDY